MAISFPSSANAIHQPLADFIDQLKGQVTTQKAKLDDIQSPVYTPSALADSANQLNSLRGELNTLLFSAFVIGFTPYQYRVGNDGKLSANTALAFAAEKLTDNKEPITANYGLALVISAASKSQLASQLQSLVNLLPFPEWVNCFHLSAKNAVMAVEKMQVPTARLNPHWRADDFSNNQPLANTYAYLDAELATSESVAESATNPVERLKQLADKKNQVLSKLLDDMGAFIASFYGDCTAIKLTGTPSQMAKQLSETSVSEQAYSSVFLLVSDDEPTFFYQMVGV